ncbi:MAG: ATP-binding protein [Candidatus Gastranaerophilales bacterium]|nr:ATP-binding protein [Candidatus Gastranaerophilales bacterium]MCM1073562.1 ATP-binding protein [Bacteroides sp.]
MRINPIQNIGIKPIYLNNRLNKEATKPETDNILAPAADNYGKAMVFKSKADKIKNFVANAPFEDKLAVGIKEMFNGPRTGNVLIAVKDMKEVPRIMDYLQIPVPIAKLSILTDNNIDFSLLFARNGNTVSMVNTSNIPFITPMLDMLESGGLVDIQLGDHFFGPTGWFEIKEAEKDSLLEKHSNMFLQSLDYSEEIERTILKHNKNIKTFIEETLKPTTKSKGLSFDAVGGQDEVIESLKKNVLFPLKYPDVFDGFMVSRGAILYGPPGTGKTLIAQTLAAESGASIFELCATDLADKYVGESEKNCRELFAKAVDAQPSIIYFDEIDALGKARGKDQYGDKLLAQFLSLMSDIEKRGDNVFVIGSTNRREDLDSAFTRSGRFSTLLEVKAPDLKGTRQILEIHTNGKPIDEDVDMEHISSKMYAKKMTGADIAATVKEAFSHALERTGIYESMARNAYSPMMKDFLTINTEDFITAINKFNNGSNQRRPIGYNK